MRCGGRVHRWLDRSTAARKTSVALLPGCLLLRCRAEAIKSRSDLDLLQTSLRQVHNELCLRQSTGDSTGPQIDVAAGILGKVHLEGNISKVQASAGLEYPDDFGEPA